MAKKVKNLFKRLAINYLNGMNSLYGECIKYNIPINM